jgi:hypothetical protein
MELTEQPALSLSVAHASERQVTMTLFARLLCAEGYSQLFRVPVPPIAATAAGGGGAEDDAALWSEEKSIEEMVDGDLPWLQHPEYRWLLTAYGRKLKWKALLDASTEHEPDTSGAWEEFNQLKADCAGSAKAKAKDRTTNFSFRPIFTSESKSEIAVLCRRGREGAVEGGRRRSVEEPEPEPTIAQAVVAKITVGRQRAATVIASEQEARGHGRGQREGLITLEKILRDDRW